MLSTSPWFYPCGTCVFRSATAQIPLRYRVTSLCYAWTSSPPPP